MTTRAGTSARAILAALLLAAALGCSPQAPREQPTAAPTAAAPLASIAITLRPPGGGRGQRIRVEDAFTAQTRARGLMFRPHVAPRSGMVFRYPGDSSGGYWMKNTLVPLSIAFFDRDGRVVRVLDMAPCRRADCPSYDPKVTYAGALEVNQGFFDEIGLTRGWRIELPSGLPPAT